MKFIKNTKYYYGVVYEWNLPTGTTCPFALECKVTVDRQTGKFDIKRGQYKCYAASPERFPGVREHRWKNFEYVKNGGVPEIPKDCTAIRIHASGDFFNQSYFDMWLQLAMDNPNVEMWAYTKSVAYWVKRINDIPSNLIFLLVLNALIVYIVVLRIMLLKLYLLRFYFVKLNLLLKFLLFR